MYVVYAGTVIAFDNITAKSLISHSGRFSETKSTLSPSLIYSLKIFATLKIQDLVSNQVNFFLLIVLSHSKKISF